MKTNTFFVLCLLLGIGLTQLSAQPTNKKGIGSVSWDINGPGWYTDVWCDGVWIAYMEGISTFNIVDHYQNGVWQWRTMKICGVSTYSTTGEIYTFSEQDKIGIPDGAPKPNVWTSHANIKGDKGALYNISFIAIIDDDWNTISIVVKNATCTGNTK